MCSGICDHIVGVARESDGLRFIPRRELKGSLEPHVTYVCNRSGCHRFTTPVDIHNCIRGKCKFWDGVQYSSRELDDLVRGDIRCSGIRGTTVFQGLADMVKACLLCTVIFGIVLVLR